MLESCGSPSSHGGAVHDCQPSRHCHWQAQESAGAHPAIVISKGKVRTAAEVTGGMWSFLSFTVRRIRVISSSTAAWSFAWRLARTADPAPTHAWASARAASNIKIDMHWASYNALLQVSLQVAVAAHRQKG